LNDKLFEFEESTGFINVKNKEGEIESTIGTDIKGTSLLEIITEEGFLSPNL